MWRQTTDLSGFDSNTFFISREEVDRFFSSMDRDFDGRLSFAEIMGEETPIEKLFKLMDKNGDGFVSKKVGCNNFLIIRLSDKR